MSDVLMLQALLSRHARCQELGLSQDICHPPPSLREVPSRPGVETHRYVVISLTPTPCSIKQRYLMRLVLPRVAVFCLRC